MSFHITTVDKAAPIYDAIVVGSGYGGGVAASRLSRMGLKVAVIELGRRWRPGDFPVTATARAKALRLTGLGPKLGSPAGLYYLSVGKGLTVFGASGLGGGSLINAGVVLRPDLDRLRKWGWPAPVLDDGLFTEGLSRAESMLGVAPVPEPERFGKYRGMRELAKAAGVPVTTPAMTIAHQPRVNTAGVMQYACRYCGDCWSGCNLGAKTTTAITYIADAVDHGASVFCEARVERIAKLSHRWELEVKDLSGTGEMYRVSAPICILAAGTLGTNEILLRAKARGLPLSDKLGAKFSANGDDLVIASDFSESVNGIATGFPPQAPSGLPPVGPHSMALIDLGDENGPVWVHDGTMLRIMAALTPFKDIVELHFREAFRSLRQGIYGEELSRTQLLYVVAHDIASGRLTLEKDHVIVDWPGYGDAPERTRAETKVKEMIERMGGRFHENPFAWNTFGGNRIIAHPLGGCAIAETAEAGVVATDGQVFDPSQGQTGVHRGLYVLDSAAIPSSVGVSPLLTITALAERAMILAGRQLERTLDVHKAPMRCARDASM